MSIRSLFLCVILTTFSGPFLFAQSGEFGRIKGSIFDQSLEAVVPGINVTIAGNGIVRSMDSDVNGEYNFSLPPGIYEITTTKAKWWFPVIRAKTEILPDTTTIVNLYLSSRECTQALEATSKGIIDRFLCDAKSPKYARISQTDTETSLIEFNGKLSTKDAHIYRNAKLTVGRLTVIATEIHVAKKSGIVAARGSVLVDNNGVRSRMDFYTVEP